MKNTLSQEVTFCLTTFNRNDLLFKTLDSFININSFPISRYLIRDDSDDQKVIEQIQKRYPFIKVIGGKNIGQAGSIDILYSYIETPYIFHCEEDWLFEGNLNFIADSIAILEERPDIHQVWIRTDINQDWIDKEIFSIDKCQFRIVKSNHLGGWNGFSWNPGLRRLSDYKLMFPNGYSEFQNSRMSEYNCMCHSKNFLYKSAQLINGSCKHIGYGKSTYK